MLQNRTDNKYICFKQNSMTITTIYQGELRTEATHVATQTTILTDAPLDNKGKGSTFSPTDLMCASLGSCMLTIMGIYAQEHEIDISKTNLSIQKIMASDPRRVLEIKLQFDFPKNDFSEKHRLSLKRVARNCPVAKSLHPDLIQTVTFNF